MSASSLHHCDPSAHVCATLLQLLLFVEFNSKCCRCEFSRCLSGAAQTCTRLLLVCRPGQAQAAGSIERSPVMLIQQAAL